MPVVGRSGVRQPEQIRRNFGIAANKRIAIVYAGTFGLDTAPWARLEQFVDWEFIGLHPLPVKAGNFHTASDDEFRFENLCASADCVVGKLGYGIYADCLCNGVPVVFPARTGFAEYPVLERSVLEWGHGYRLEKQQFLNLDWDSALEEILSAPRPVPLKTGGALKCARRIEQAALQLL
jgi:hypothetical protein